jgi:acyl carrier protein
MQLTRESVLNAVREFFHEERGIDPAAVREETAFIDDLGIDSLDVMEMLTELEDRWEIRISNTDLRGITTISDAIDLVLEKASSPSTAVHQ